MSIPFLCSFSELKKKRALKKIARFTPDEKPDTAIVDLLTKGYNIHLFRYGNNECTGLEADFLIYPAIVFKPRRNIKQSDFTPSTKNVNRKYKYYENSAIIRIIAIIRLYAHNYAHKVQKCLNN